MSWSRTLTIATLSLYGISAAAYETVAVKNGGTVKGTITLTGKAPKAAKAKFPKKLNATDRKYCGSKRPVNAAYYRTRGGKLADVVIWLQGVKRGKQRQKRPGALANAGCRFTPLVQTIDVGAKLVVENRDPILHNTHPIYLKSKITAFNVGMPKKGQKIKKKVRRAGVMKVQCDAGHLWMRAWVHAFKHPYHTVSKADGSFELGQVPPGSYTLKAWHERAGTLTKKVKVGAGGVVKINLSFRAK